MVRPSRPDDGTVVEVECESMRTGERIRDVAVYSLVAREWPGAGGQ